MTSKRFGNKRSGSHFALLLSIALLASSCAGSADSEAGTLPEDSAAAAQPTIVSPPESLPLASEAELLDTASRDWSTLLATTTDAPLWLDLPSIGPDGLPTAATAQASRAHVWTYVDGSWGVAQNVDLPEQYVIEAAEGLPATFTQEFIVTDGNKADLRFLLPTAYANGPAVAAIGHNGTEWTVLGFSDATSESVYAADAVIQAGEIIIWHNDCIPSCADGTQTKLRTTRTDDGYRIDDPPPAPPTTSEPVTPPAPGDACAPGSWPDCVDQYGTDDWRYIEGWTDCVANLGDSGSCIDLDEDGYAGYPDSG